MPAFLAMVSRLFTREFSTQYASIREKCNSYFRKWMERDLCIYRPESTESVSNVMMSSICSKPSSVIQQLEIDIESLQQKVKINSTIKEVIDDDDVENDNPFGSDDDDDDF